VRKVKIYRAAAIAAVSAAALTQPNGSLSAQADDGGVAVVSFNSFPVQAYDEVGDPTGQLGKEAVTPVSKVRIVGVEPDKVLLVIRVEGKGEYLVAPESLKSAKPDLIQRYLGVSGQGVKCFRPRLELPPSDRTAG